MQHDTDVIGADAGDFRHLFVGEVFQEKGDERLFDRAEFVDGRVEVGDAVVRAPFCGLPRFNRAGEVGVLKMNDAVQA